jgi:GAF domain-containing protein
MTALPSDAVADLYKLVAELEQRLESSFAAHDEAIARAAATAEENARLRNELGVAREQQTASADILSTIANTSGDAERALYQIAETSARLFGAPSATIHIAEGDGWSKTIRFGDSSKRVGAGVPDAQLKIGGRNMPGTIVGDNRQVNIPDVDHVDPAISDWPGLPYVRAAGTRSMSGSPLRREGKAIGALIVYRDRLEPFTDVEMAVQQTFADQAAIAIENARLFKVTEESLARQTATSDILRVISQSQTDVQPVFDAIVLTAVRLLRCDIAFVLRCDGATYSPAAVATPEGPMADRGPANLPIDPDANFPSRAIVGQRMLHLPDWSLIDLPEHERRIHELFGVNSALYLPLLRDGECIGLLALAGKRPGIFGENEIALAESFRDQALIAIENVRLFNETQEALERQTATADILKVIAGSPSDTTPVFEAIAHSAKRLLGGFSAAVFRYVDGMVHLAAFTPTKPAADAALRADFPTSVDDFAAFRLARDGEPFVIPDTEEVSRAAVTEIARKHGFRSMLWVPMMNGGVTIGILSVTRAEPGAFASHHTQLLQTFADQAVIAIENARLFNETQEALEQQQASANILRVVSNSVADTQPVFEEILNSIEHLFDAEERVIFLAGDDGLQHIGAIHGPSAEQVRAQFPAPLEGTASEIALRERRLVSSADVFNDPAIPAPARERARRFGNNYAMVVAPMLWEDRAVGSILVARASMVPFSEKECNLLRTFADQAVIAIQNARLFDEVQQRTNDLSESLQQQTAVGDVLKTISRSTFDLQPVLDTLVNTAALLCDAEMAFILRREGEVYRAGAAVGYSSEYIEYLRNHPLSVDRGSITGRAVLERRTVQILDVATDPEYTLHESTTLAGQHTTICVPLLRENEPIGTIVLARRRVEPFTQKQIDLVTTFADQAVIAIENVRLFDELRQRTDDLSQALTYQTGSSKILSVIASSPTDVGPVLKAIAESACELCEAFDSVVLLRDGEDLRFDAHHGAIPMSLAKWPINRNWTAGRAFVDQKPVHVHDLLSFEGDDFPEGREMSRRMGHRSILSVPLLREGESIGVIVLRRTEVRPFSDKQIALLQTFADQAVIAIENARLFNETQEALERQTATAEVLKVIASSPSDVQPVFDAIADRSKRLTGGHSTAVFRFIDQMIELVAFTPASREADAVLQAAFPAPLDRHPMFRLVRDGGTVQICDTESDEGDMAGVRDIARARGFRSMIFTPLLGDKGPIGLISATRREPSNFSNHIVGLLGTFADQAVIAIENTRLFNEVQHRTNDLSESLQQQTATADVLKVISRSAFDLQTVLDTLVESAARLCEADMAAITRQKGNEYFRAGSYGFTPEFMDCVKDIPVRPERATITGRTLLEGRVIHVPDVHADPDYSFTEAQRLSGDPRTFLGVPLLREGNPVGALVLLRKAARPFTDKQIELVTTFADQAVIAIENVRLFDEVQAKTRDLSEALTYQTGSGKILSVIASSPTDVGPALEAIVESACELCAAYDAVVVLKGDNDLSLGAHHGPIPMNQTRWANDRTSISGRAIADRLPVHLRDVLSDEGTEFPAGQEMSRRDGCHTILGVPMLREGESIGAIVLRRTEVQPFSDKQIALLQTFADQAVIAIGNVRLFDEVQAKTRDLSEALTYQTGSGNILRVIASSPTDVKPVLTAIVESACELCEADDALATLREGDELVFQAQHGSIPVVWDRQPIDRQAVAGLAVIDRAPVHVHDLLAPEGEQFVRAREFARTTNVRTVLCVPLLREGESIGVIVLRRTEVRPFGDKQIALLQTFADQAVIAIGNVRLFEEVQQRTRELSESLEQQTATSEVLSVISRSAGDLEPVFQSMLENATRICGAQFGLMNLYDGGSFHTVGFHNVPPEFEAARKQSFQARPDGDLGQMVQTKKFVHIHDLRTRPLYLEGDPATVQLADLAGARTILIVPMVKDDEFIGTIGIYRLEVSPFNEKQIALLSSFASQAVIAIENTRLLKELRERTDDLTKSLDDLRTAQDRLVQTEKLASLGQLTAGIAHEIKNPLNFVNNFAALSAELTDELNDVLKQATITEKMRDEVDELTGLLKDNLQKVVQHGKRADSIVKNMLLHSREGSGDHRPADINALVDESLNLAYHGARAERPNFNVTLQRDFDTGAGSIEVFPQEITRVLLNLVSNGFYAVTKRKAEAGDSGFDPVLVAATRNLGDAVEIRIRDNGNGIPPEVREKMFNPFFTTKPAGEGTGLGLSMSHDIIVKQHGGTIDVATEPGQFTEFCIVLPRTSKSSK